MYKTYRVKVERVLGGEIYAKVGDVVYDSRGHDYGLASDDTRFSGQEHISVTRNADGSHPFFTIPKSHLEEVKEGSVESPPQDGQGRKKPLSALFANLRVADIVVGMADGENTAQLFLESMTCEETLSIVVSVPREALHMYDFGDYEVPTDG